MAKRAHRPRRPVRRRPRRGGGAGRSAPRDDTTWLVVLANIGFLLNAFNLLPIGFLDGGTVVRSISLSRRGWIRYENGVPVEAVPPDREHANLITFLYVLLAAALVGRDARDPAQRDALRRCRTASSSRPTTRSSTCGSARRRSATSSSPASRRWRRSTVRPSRASARRASPEGSRAVRARPRDGAALRGGGLGRRHGRRAGRDGGGEPRLPRRRRALGRASGSSCPHEQPMNDYIDLGLVFDHFYARKTMFVKAAEGFCVFPGGFGTADELFESLTLIQTGKVMHFPVVLLGEAYWTPLLEWVRRSALADGMVSPEDLELLTLTDDPQRRARDGARRLPRRRRGSGARTSRTRPTRSSVCAMELRDLPSVDELAREAGDPLAVDAARAVIDRAREEIQAGSGSGRSRGAAAGGARRRAAAAAAGRAQRDGRRRPHESRPRAARRGGGRAGRRGCAGLLEPRVRPDARASAARARITSRRSCAG